MVDSQVNLESDKSKASTNPLPDSLSDANHPLAMPAERSNSATAAPTEVAKTNTPASSDHTPSPKETAANPRVKDSSPSPELKGAVELLKDASGKITEGVISQDKLSPGDHTIQMQDGRQFVMHIPENASNTKLPVVFVFTGSIQNGTVAGTSQKTPEDFIQETAMNQAADQNNFIAVYPMPEFHKLGAGSTLPAYAWNAAGAGIDKADVKQNGYSDLDFVKSIANALPSLANVDSSHQDWGAIGFSQGGIFLNDLAHKIPDLFPTVGLVGSTIETGQNNETAEGNAKNVMIVNLRADKDVLPFGGLANESPTYIKNDAEYSAASLVFGERWARETAESMDPLGGINNFNQDPYAQQELYTKELDSKGPVTVTQKELDTGVTKHYQTPGPFSNPTIDMSPPLDPSNKVTETIIKPKDSQNDGTLTVFDLWDAQHAYPGPNRGAQINTAMKNPFDTTAEFVKEFVDFNKAEKNNSQT